MTETKSFANFNTVTFEANVFNVDIVEGQYGEYAAITLIANFADDDGGFTIKFNNSNGLLALTKKGHLINGRRVLVTGRISSVAQVWFDKTDGQTKMLKRPQIELDARTVQLTLGAKPASAMNKRTPVAAGTVVGAPVDQTPDLPGEVQDQTGEYGSGTPVGSDGTPIF